MLTWPLRSFTRRMSTEGKRNFSKRCITKVHYYRSATGMSDHNRHVKWAEWTMSRRELTISETIVWGLILLGSRGHLERREEIYIHTPHIIKLSHPHTLTDSQVHTAGWWRRGLEWWRLWCSRPYTWHQEWTPQHTRDRSQHKYSPTTQTAEHPTTSLRTHYLLFYRKNQLWQQRLCNFRNWFADDKNVA